MNQTRFTGFHEGLRNAAYLDSLGNWTIGYGHKFAPGLEAMLAGNHGAALRISTAQADTLLAADLSVAQQDFIRLFGEMGGEINGARRIALTDMLFNLGRGQFLAFRATIRAIRAGDWHRGALQALQSRWALQVGARARRVAYALETGAFAPAGHALHITEEGPQ